MHTEEYKGIKIEIFQDEDPPNPRKENDIFSTMVCWHRRYNLGDEQPKCEPEEYTFQKGCFDVTIDKHPSYRFLDLYLYDHSGITMNTSGFSCNWDSGKVGFIFTDKDRLRQVFQFPKSASWKTLVKNPWYRENKTPREILSEGFPNDKKITLEGLAYRYMVSDVKEYDQYLRGDCYVKKIYFPDGEEICGGYYGFDYTLEEAKIEIDSFLKRGI